MKKIIDYKEKIKLYQQVVNTILFIIKDFDLGYLFLLLFDNITSYFIYAKNIL